MASGSGSKSSRSSVKDRSGYGSSHDEDALSKFVPRVSLGNAHGWKDRGIETSRTRRQIDRGKGGKAKRKTKHLELQHSSTTTDGEAAGPGKARMKKDHHHAGRGHGRHAGGPGGRGAQLDSVKERYGSASGVLADVGEILTL